MDIDNKEDIEALREFTQKMLDIPEIAKTIPNPNNYPETIYKYRDWNDKNHKKLLKKNELYMAAANQFNDPFDCKIYKNYFLLDTPEKVNEYIDVSLERANDYLREKNMDKSVERESLLSKLEDRLRYQIRAERIDDEYNNKYVGILSMSSRWNSILMWSHYANHHKGFCVGFDEKKMRISGLFGTGGTVSYQNDFPKIYPLDSDIKTQMLRTFYKSEEWRYEEEYRFLNLYYDQRPIVPNRIVKFKDEFIKEIVLGLHMPEKYKNEIVKIAKDKNIDVYQTFKIPFKFELDREKI